MRSPQHLREKGFTLIELIVVVGIFGLLLALSLPAIQRVREAAYRTQCQNNLKQIGLALHQYHDSHGALPAGYIWKPLMGSNPMGLCPNLPDDPTDTDPGWGWAALLLPYIEQDPLRQQIDLNTPVGDGKNDLIRTTALPLFVCPADQNTGVFSVRGPDGAALAPAATNSYAACYGAGGEITEEPDQGNGIFFRNSRIRLTDITDGTSHTLAIGERAALFTQTPWAGAVCEGTTRITLGAPTTSTAVEDSPTQTLAHTGSHTLNDPSSDPDDFYTPHRPAGNFLFADGSVQPVRTNIDLAVLQALSTRAGGEAVNPDDF